MTSCKTREFEDGVERESGAWGISVFFKNTRACLRFVERRDACSLGKRLCVGRRDQRIEDPDLRFVFAGSIGEEDGVELGNWRVWRTRGGEEAVSGRCVVGSEHSTIYGITVWKMFVETLELEFRRWFPGGDIDLSPSDEEEELTSLHPFILGNFSGGQMGVCSIFAPCVPVGSSGIVSISHHFPMRNSRDQVDYVLISLE
ncbi:uncharacterized protein EAF02_010123 [Botrytis sinoallii]|uniref:uncharacterized protein n=1 Tax=Botrytis sinoallii TaxID=1463999 RepID=UPI001902B84C|nr:uncharacterized protein EAF02_010123 [Botrytis sinoallii]KAF7864155.1 hypothetical protein EAF02_010123 [Botrytis sinoallii]